MTTTPQTDAELLAQALRELDALRAELRTLSDRAVADVRELRAEIERLKGANELWAASQRGQQQGYQEALDGARAEIERLRAVVGAAKGIALRDNPAHQRLRKALEALGLAGSTANG